MKRRRKEGKRPQKGIFVILDRKSENYQNDPLTCQKIMKISWSFLTCDKVLQLKFHEILIRFDESNQKISKKVKVFN